MKDNWEDLIKLQHSILVENKMMTYKEFLLSESFKPREIGYGTDLINKEWIKLEYTNTYISFFKKIDTFAVIVAKRGNQAQISFSINYKNNVKKMTNEKFYDYIKNIKSVSDIAKKFKFTRTGKEPTANIMQVFNNIIYIFIEAIKKFNLNEVYFYSFSTDLQHTFLSMVESKLFNKYINEIGYIYDGYSEITVDDETRFLFKLKKG
jgi:hypothetical protein